MDQVRGTALAVVVLLGILGVTFATLLGTGRKMLVEAERARRQIDYEDAASAVADRVEVAQEKVRLLAEAESLEIVADPGADPRARRAAFRRLDQLLTRLARDPDVRRMGVLPRDGGPALCGFDRLLGSSPQDQLDVPPLPAVALAALKAGPGVLVLGLVSRPTEPANLGAAIQIRGLIVFLELDASQALTRCASAAEDGEWALVDGEGRIIWPPEHRTLPFPPEDAPSTRSGNATVVGDDGEHVISISRVARNPRWRLLVKAPLTDRLPDDVRIGLALTAVTVVLVLLLGVRGARAATLQRSLSASAQKEQELQGMFDAMTDVLVVVDKGLKIIRTNKVARETYGQDLAGLPYQALLERRGMEDTEAEAAQVAELFSRGEPRRQELAVKDSVWVVIQYPIFDRALTVTGLIEHARDVTQTKRLQSQLVQSEKLSTLGELSAGIAHEINNPIGVISMFAQLLTEEIRETRGEDAPELEKVRTIEEQAVNVGDIVQGLLRFARKSEGTKSLFDARSAVTRAESIVSHQKMLRNIEVERDLSDTPLQVLGDEGQLAQVILNLVVNAHHAMEGEGSLKISVRAHRPEDPPPGGRPFGQSNQTPRRVLIAVSDTGKGIPPDRVERIFEPFFTTKAQGEGTGLGLSVGFGIIRDHGGCIWVDSREGVGTTFTIDLPAAEEDTE